VKQPGQYQVKVTGSLFDVAVDASAVPGPGPATANDVEVRAAAAGRQEGRKLKRCFFR